MADITISHTRAGGTLVDGTSKGDGVYQLMRPHGFRWSPSLGQIYLAHSRDRRAKTWVINQARTALEEAGHTVTVEIDEDERRSFAEAEQERYARAGERATLFAGYAASAEATSDGAWARARHMGEVMQGEPVKVGHHSERRHRRDLERVHALHGKAVEAHRRAKHYAGRAVASADYEKHRRSPGVTLRRIDGKEADLRRVERQQIRTLQCLVEDVARTDQLAESWEELGRRHDELAEEIGYWRDVIAEAEANGVKIWSREDFTKGDFVRSGGTWYEVLRANPKTLTVPYTLSVAKVVTAAEHQQRGLTYPIEYSKVGARMSGEEMRQVLAEVAARRADGA